MKAAWCSGCRAWRVVVMVRAKGSVRVRTHVVGEAGAEARCSGSARAVEPSEPTKGIG